MVRSAATSGKIIRAENVQMSQAFSHGHWRMRFRGRVKAALIIAAATIRSSENEREARGDTGACICWEGYRLCSLSSMRVFAAIDQRVHDTVRRNFSEDFFRHLSCRIRRLAHTNESRSTCCISRFVVGTDIRWCFCGRIFLTIQCEPGGFTGGRLTLLSSKKKVRMVRHFEPARRRRTTRLPQSRK